MGKAAKRTRQQLKELCEAHSELQRVMDEHSIDTGSRIIDKMYRDQISELGNEIIRVAKSLFGKEGATNKAN